MEVCVQCSCSVHSPTSQLLPHPFTAHKSLPGFLSSQFRCQRLAWTDQPSVRWATFQKHCSKNRHVAVCYLANDAGDAKTHYFRNTSHAKVFVSELFRKWGPSVAVGAMVGAIISRKALIFVLSFFSVVLFASRTASEAPELLHLNQLPYVLSRQSLTNLLTTTRTTLCAVIVHITSEIMTGIGRILKSICQRLESMCSLLPLNPLAWNQKDSLKNVALGSRFNSSEILISDINSCIETVEGVIISQRGTASEVQWIQLKDSLFSLKKEVASLSNVNNNIGPLTDVSVSSGSMLEVLAKNSKSLASLKSKGIKSGQSVMDEMREIHVARKETKLAQISIDQIPGNLDGGGRTGDISLIESFVPANLSSTGFKRAPSDQGVELPSKETNDSAVENAQLLASISMQTSETEFRKPQSKYIDYWLEPNPTGPIYPKDVEEHIRKVLDKEGLALQTDQDSEVEIAPGTLSSEPGQASFHTADKHAKSLIEEGDLKKAECETNIMKSSKDGDGAEIKPGIVRNERAPTKPAAIDNRIKDTAWTNVKEKRTANRLQHDIMSGFSQKACVGAEQFPASQGSTKELPFGREDPDLHVLTGISRSFEDGEFQRLMTDGETALKRGKTGLSGDLEVGEAESMFFKAADCFGSAAALDPYCVEALGFWGNTLLVHGELKLMLSRELRHSLSMPDFISPYWLRQKKGAEVYESSHLTALQQTCQAVCEECEELLIQAGRKYRRILSISNSEVRALYNWGLALCSRAKLIAETGGQNTVEDADRIYLAAIDKFEAMMGISQRYAPGAMLHWGLTLKDRSRLRPADSMERIALLQQAKQLLLDALRLQPEDAQIQSAFVTCCVELKELSKSQDTQSRKKMRFMFGT